MSIDLKGLEVDHIYPKSRRGPDEIENYQALCFSCNAAKGNKDNTDFRQIAASYLARSKDCPFCEIDPAKIMHETSLAYVIRDAFPVAPLHTLVIPKRHTLDYFGLYQPEVNALNRMVIEQRVQLQQSDTTITGFNIGFNCGEDAGQTIFHCHVHLIPRRKGDMALPRGGVRNVMPGKGPY